MAYCPISLSDCPTDLEQEERLEWIETQIGQTAGVLHFPGVQFGKPIENSAAIEFPHLPSPHSIHHFEWLTALENSKRTWVILPEKGCTHDKYPNEPDDLIRAQKSFLDYLEAQGLLHERAKNNAHFEQLLTEHYYETADLDLGLARHSENSAKKKPSAARTSSLVIAMLAILTIGVGLFQHLRTSPVNSSDRGESINEDNLMSARHVTTDFQPLSQVADSGGSSADLSSLFTTIQYAICELQLQVLAGEPPLSSWSADQRESELTSLLGWPKKQLTAALLLPGTTDIQRAQASLISNRRDRAEKEFDAIIDSSGNESAISLAHLGKAIIAQDRGDHQDALDWFQKNAEAIERKASPTLWANAHHPVAFQLAVLGRFEESEKLLRDILEAKASSQSDAQHRLAGIQRSLTRVLLATDRAEEAQPIMENVLDADVKVFGKNHALVALDHHLLASVRASLADHEKAESSYRSALAIAESRYGKFSPQLLTTLTSLAEFLHKRGKLSEAAPVYRRALSIHDQKNDESSVAHASMLGNLAGLLLSLKKPDEAEPLYQQTIDRFEKLEGASTTRLSAVLINYARLLDQRGRTAEAIATIQRAITIVESSLGKNHPEVASSLLFYAKLLQQSEQNAQAEFHLRRALAIDVEAYGDYHVNTARDLEHIAEFLITNDRANQAEGPVRHALEIREIKDGKRHQNYAANLVKLSVILAASNRRSEAVQYSHEALVIYATLQKNSGKFNNQLADIIDHYRTCAPQDTLDEELAKIGEEAGWNEQDWKKLTEP